MTGICSKALAVPDRKASGIKCLVAAYPRFLRSGQANGIVWRDGTTTVYDDGKKKRTYKELLDRASLWDQMSIGYPAGSRYPSPPPLNYDPGRVRNQEFFTRMYGGSAKAVRRNLARVRWSCGASRDFVLVTRINDVHSKVESIAKQLGALGQRYRKFVSARPETFVWRKIQGTRRLSMHSFGIAVDIAVKHSHYWRWTKPGPDGRFVYRNKIPWPVVEVFEKHGFIWGGKWYHFDTMHFEYRPELFVAGCAASNR